MWYGSTPGASTTGTASVGSSARPKTLAKLVAGYVSHLDYHLKFLYAKRANLGMSLYPRYSME